MLKFRCKECDQKIGVPEEWAGHNVRCPRCRNTLYVPRVIEAVAEPVAVGAAPQRPPVSGAPKAPLMPMPPLKGKTVAVPHPAVKRKAPAKPAVVIPPATGTGQKPAEALSHPKREKSPEPTAPPDPVIVSAKRAVDSIVTEAPTSADFSSLFSGGNPGGVGSSDISRSVVSPAESGGDVESEVPASGAPLSDMIDAMGGPEEPGVTSSATVSDIVKGLTREPIARLPVAPVVSEPRVREDAPTSQARAAVAENAWAWGIGIVAMCLGVGALALCVTPRMTRLALPVGSCGLLLAVIGAVVPARRRGTEVALALGSSAVSGTGVALAILVATGIVPSAATARAVAKQMPGARIGDVEVRVASVTVVHPVLYAAGNKNPTVDQNERLRVGIEVRNLGRSGSVAYRSWGVSRGDLEPVILQDDEGNQLKLKDPSPDVPPGRPREFPFGVAAQSGGATDVLLFEAPPAAVRELFLQLPGSNVQTPGVFNIQIPASMLRKQ